MNQDRSAQQVWTEIGKALFVVFAVILAGALLNEKPMAAIAIQALLAEIGSGFLLVTWSDPHQPLPSTGDLVRRALRGAVFGTVVAFAIVVLSVATGRIALRVDPFLPTLLAGLVISVLRSVRDELLVRGLSLRLTRSLSEPLRIAFSGLSSAAFWFGQFGSKPYFTLVSAFFLGAISGWIWLRDSGAWMSVAFTSAVTFGLTAVVHGGIFAGRATQATGHLLSEAGAAATFPIVFAALALWFWEHRQKQTPPPPLRIVH